MSDIAAIEDRIWGLLEEPYREQLEESTIYGMPALKWPGAKAHDYFAGGETRQESHVSIFLLVADTYPEALEGTDPILLKRRTGKAAFTFPTLDDEMARELQLLLARAVRALRHRPRRVLTGHYPSRKSRVTAAKSGEAKVL